MPEIELDPELLSDFIIESRELLDDYSAKLIDLETHPDDPNVIGAIFRAAHTLKGSSAFFNLIHIKNFAHKLENLLDDLRNKRRSVTSEVVDFLLTGGHHLQNMFDRVGTGDYSTDLNREEDEFLKKLLSLLEKGPPAPAAVSESILKSVQSLTTEYKSTRREPDQVLLQIDALLAGLPMTAEPAAPSAPIKKKAESKVVRYIYQGLDLTEPLQAALTTMERAEETGSLDAGAYDQALGRLQDLSEKHDLTGLKEPLASAIEDFAAVRDSSIGFDPLLLTLLKDKLKAVVNLVEKVEAEPLPEAQAVSEKEPPQAEAEPRTVRAAREERVERKTMRIDEEKVDGFMSYVGELIITAETFNYLQKRIEAEQVSPQTIRAFKNANQAFHELSDELQESLMEIRRVPIKGLFQKVTLMVRELAGRMGKKVKVEIEGQDVRLDKSIAENLEGPLVHIIRNSMDHGLENPEVREKAGKPPEGSLRVKASTDKEFFYLEIFDDGRGIDPDDMRRAAVEKGRMSEAQALNLSNKEAVNLIFGAGFSTAKEITDVSGRGVGMDVVRTNVSNLNGSINVDSIPGWSTTISLKIPLSVTLQVVKALLVRVGAENFIISLDHIIESLRPSVQELASVEGRGEVLNRRGQILPLIRLYEIFNIESQFTDPCEAILVIIETAAGRFGLLVDEVIGQQQVVVKDLGTQFKNLACLAGSAILGDGRLGLVLDADGLVRLALGL